MRRVIIFTAILAAAGAGVTWATRATAQNLIDSVVVVGVKHDKNIAPTQLLEGEDLHRLNAGSVADAIRYFSGVQIKDYGGVGGLKTVNVRSLGAQHTAVFYDGVQIGNAQNGTVDLGRFSMDNMEAIELANGQRNGLLQSAREFTSAGAVYLRPRKPIFADGRRSNTKLSLAGGSFGTVNPAAMWETRLTKNVDAQINAEYLYTTGRYKFTYATRGGYDTTAVRQNGDMRAMRVEGGVFGQLPQGDWRAKFYLYNSERGYPGASVKEAPGTFRHQDRQWDDNIFAQASLRQFAGPYSVMVNAKLALDKLRYMSDPTAVPPVDNRFTQLEGDLSLAQSVELKPHWRMALATDAQLNSVDADMTDFASPRRLTLLAAAVSEVTFSRFSAHASIQNTLIHDKVAAASGSGAGVAGEAASGSGAAGDKNKLTPTLMAVWNPTASGNLTIRALYKRTFRMPTLNDLYYTFIGNKNLEPELATQYNMGVVWKNNRIQLNADAYINLVDNKIVAMPANNQFQWTMTNLGYVEIRGLDLGAQNNWQLRQAAVTLRLTYSWQLAQDKTNTPSAPADEWFGGLAPYCPRHSGSAVAGAAWRGWNLNYSFIYTGERFSSRANTPENRILPWYTHDMALTREWILGSGASGASGGARVRMSLEVNNILNQQYEVVNCYPMPGTNFKIKLAWTL